MNKQPVCARVCRTGSIDITGRRIFSCRPALSLSLCNRRIKSSLQSVVNRLASDTSSGRTTIPGSPPRGGTDRLFGHQAVSGMLGDQMTDKGFVAPWATLALAGAGLSGCAAIPPDACAPQTREIARLQQALAARETEIEQLKAQKQGQTQELVETTTEAARAEVKLRRFASEAEVASRLAEIEVAMESLRVAPADGPAAAIRATAQRLLERATAAFNRGELSKAVELASQTEQLCDMLKDNRSLAPEATAPEVPFKLGVPLAIATDARLRLEPHTDAAVVAVLPPMTPVSALAYRGAWLRVQTEDERSGWVLGKLLTAREPLPQAVQ